MFKYILVGFLATAALGSFARAEKNYGHSHSVHHHEEEPVGLRSGYPDYGHPHSAHHVASRHPAEQNPPTGIETTPEVFSATDEGTLEKKQKATQEQEQKEVLGLTKHPIRGGVELGYGFLDNGLGEGFMYALFVDTPAFHEWMKIGLSFRRTFADLTDQSFFGGYLGYSLKDHIKLGTGEFAVIADLGLAKFSASTQPYRLGYGLRAEYDRLFNIGVFDINATAGFLNSRPSSTTITDIFISGSISYVF